MGKIKETEVLFTVDEVELSKCARQNMERNRHDCQDYIGEDGPSGPDGRKDAQSRGIP